MQGSFGNSEEIPCNSPRIPTESGLYLIYGGLSIDLLRRLSLQEYINKSSVNKALSQTTEAASAMIGDLYFYN